MNKLSRSSGVLLHITSLPGPYGIGELGPQAYKFVDDLVEMDQSLWQILPDNPTDNYNCPYGSISAFANNPFLISLDYLIKDGWLDIKDLDNYPKSALNSVSFDDIKSTRYSIMLKAANNFLRSKTEKHSKNFNNFCNNNRYWLDTFCTFIVLQNLLNEEQWFNWPLSYKSLDIKSINAIIIKNIKKINEIKALQYLYHEQWDNLKVYANSKGIQIIGDIPIYVSINSADVWENQKLFKLDAKGKMIMQSGCPPDVFVKTGQIWGHPIYNWSEHHKNNYTWWTNRISNLFKKVDIVRIDHFNGFAKYWEIPAEDSNGLNGRWMDGPGENLFFALNKVIKNKIILAEDLGEASSDAKVIRDQFGIPGMKILQFSFGNGKPLKDLEINTVVYTGTHDNNTSIGWYYEELGFGSTELSVKHEKLRADVKKYLNLNGSNFNWSMIKYAMESEACFCIIPLQDILGLDSSARMNTPGTIGHNWEWRYDQKALNKSIKIKFKNITKETKRI